MSLPSRCLPKPIPMRVWITALAAIICGAVSASTLREFSRSLPLADGQPVRISLAFGEVTIEAAEPGKAPGEARFEVRMLSSSNPHEEAEAQFARLSFSFEEADGEVVMRMDYDRPRVSLFRVDPPKVAIRAIIPSRSPIAAVTNADPVSSRGMESPLALRTSGGKILVDGFAGEIEARTSGGSIQVMNGNGAARLETSGARIRVLGVTGSLDLRTSGGPILVERCRGSVNARSSGDRIALEGHFPSVEAHTSGGSIRARLLGPLAADSHLSTSGGSILIETGPSIPIQIDAETSAGSIEFDLPDSATTERSSGTRASVTLNGGGPTLRAKTSGGDIQLTATE